MMCSFSGNKGFVLKGKRFPNDISYKDKSINQNVCAIFHK